MKKLILFLVILVAGCTIVPMDTKNNERYNETFGYKQNYNNVQLQKNQNEISVPNGIKNKKIKEIRVIYIMETGE